MTSDSSKKPPAAKARGYHHGDLRAALLEAAREVLETASPDAVTLKSLATRLGVSQSAPYRHFETREAVLAAVAADGFRRFRAALLDSQGDAEGPERFERGCLAYLAFGRTNPGVYKLMFASDIVPMSTDGPLGDAADAAFALLMRNAEAHASPQEAQTLALWVWSTLHGLVMLQADGFMSHGMDPVAAPAAVVRRLVQAVAGGAAAG